MITFNKIISKMSLQGAWPLWPPKSAISGHSDFDSVLLKIKIESQLSHQSSYNKTVNRMAEYLFVNSLKTRYLSLTDYCRYFS